MTDLLKKIFTVGVVSTTIFWSLSVATLVNVATANADTVSLSAGQLIKVSGKPTIYAINGKGEAVYFATGDEFKSWFTAPAKGKSWYAGKYTVISMAQWDTIKVPAVQPLSVGYRPGSTLVKRESSDTLYVVEPNNTLAQIDAATAKALGYSTTAVKEVKLNAWGGYVSRGSNITSAVAHPGMFVKVNNVTYYVDSNSKLREVTTAGLTANNVQSSFVRALSADKIAGLSVGDKIDGVVTELKDLTQSGVVIATVDGALTVSLASDTPSAHNVADGTAFNEMLKLNLTANGGQVSVTGLTLNKSGYVNSNKITGVDVVDSNGHRHGNVANSVNSDNQTTILFSNDPIVVAAGQTVTVTVRANIDAEADSGTVKFGLASASNVMTLNNVTVGGGYPLWGNEMSIMDGKNSVAKATFDVMAVNANGTTMNVDDANSQEVTKFHVTETTSKEDLMLSGLTLYNYGTASPSDYKDVQLVATDGTVLATAQPDGQYVRFSLSSPYRIPKGESKDLSVRLKITGGSNKTIQLVAYNNYDVVAKGNDTSAYILVGAGTIDASFPVGDATDYNKVTIGVGSLTFNKSSDSPNVAVAPGTSNTVLAKYKVKATGEDMELRAVTLAIAPVVINDAGNNGGVTALNGNVTIKVDGMNVWSDTAATYQLASGNAKAINLSTYPTLKAGVESYITVEANVKSTATASDHYQAHLDLTQVRKLISNSISDPVVTQTAGNIINVKAASLTVKTLSTPVPQSVVKSTDNFLFARFELNATNSGEDVKVSKITVTDTKSAGADYSDLASLELRKDGVKLETSNSTATNANTVSFNLSNPLTITKGSLVTLELYANIVGDNANNGTGTHTFNIVSNNFTGVNSNGAINGGDIQEAYSGNGQTMTIAAGGTLVASLVSGTGNTPSNAQLVNVGTQDGTFFAFKLSAQYEAAKVRSLKLTATGASLAATDFGNVRLYRNSETTPFATINQFDCANNVCSYTWTATDNLLSDAIQPNSPVTIYVKADIGNAGVAKLGDSFHMEITSAGNGKNGDVQAVGAYSGTDVTFSGTPNVNSTAITTIVPFSVLVTGESPTNGSSITQTVTTGSTLARFKITNNGSAPITLRTITLHDNGGNSNNTATYTMSASTENSTDYTATTLVTAAEVTANGVVTLSTGDIHGAGVTINGGAYRYVTVRIADAAAGGKALAAGDSWSFAVAALGDTIYDVSETDLGYDGNLQNGIAGSIPSLVADGKPAVGTVVKQ